ncbi:MAG: hypothetical protein LBR39_04170 [Coriobacteriales bacterium]|jgi:hypothetical protein|nr:hypothetical protein [Coriobacteriales bacterium]
MMADKRHDLEFDWSPPSTSPESAAPASRRRDLLSNLATLLLTLVIISGGLLIPSLFYPQLDTYRNQTVMLASTDSPDTSAHIFKEPVVLYPWNLYDANPHRSLTSSQQDLLNSNGIPDFLLAALRDRGMPMPDDLGYYRLTIINGFQFLEVEADARQNCLVLVDADVDADGTADLNCAVDMSGNIISLLFLTDAWGSVNLQAVSQYITAPAGGASGASATESEGSGPSAAGDGQGDEQVDGTTPDSGAGDEAAATGGDGGGDGGEGNNAEQGAETLNPADILSLNEPLPVDEDLQIWSFAYATSMEATAFDQRILANCFAQLDASYAARYGYAFQQLLPQPAAVEGEQGEQSEQGEQEATADAQAAGGDVEAGSDALLEPDGSGSVPTAEPVVLTPTVFATEDFLLYIYDLPSGVRLVLYLDPNNLHCLGFNLLNP